MISSRKKVLRDFYSLFISVSAVSYIAYSPFQNKGFYRPKQPGNEAGKMNQKEYDTKYGFNLTPTTTIVTVLQKQRRSLQRDYCTAAGLKKVTERRVPAVRWLRKYFWKKQLFSDFVAGCTVGIYNIPQALAYSVLATLPPVYGLYASFFPPLFYFLFGSSFHSSIGVFSLVCLMTGHARTRLIPETFTGNTTTVHNIPDVSPVDIVISLSFLTGCFQLIMALFRLDFLTAYLSDSAVSGLNFGAACHALSAQFSAVLGVKLPTRDQLFLKFFYQLWDFFEAIPILNPATVLITLVTVLALVLSKIFIEPRTLKRGFPFPSELIVLIVGTVVSKVCHLYKDFNVPTVHHVPLGMPPPRVPRFALMAYLVDDAISIATVAYVVTVSMGKLFARKHQYRLDTNQELCALGLAGIGSSFFSVFPPSASLSRTLVNEEAGASSQISGLVSSLIILCVILFLGPLLEPLPMCVLSAIVIVALRSLLLRVTEVPKLWKYSKLDVVIWIVTAAVTICYDIIEGLAAGMLVSLLLVVMRTQWPNFLALGEVSPGEFHSVKNYKAARPSPVPVLRFDAALIFTNVEKFKHKVRSTLKAYRPDYPFVVILDCTPWAYTDAMGVEAVKEVSEELRDMGIRLFFANLRAAVRIQYENAGLFDCMDEDQFYPSIDDALASAQEHMKLTKKSDQISVS